MKNRWMRENMKALLFFAFVLLAITISFGAGPSEILGLWKTDGDKSRLEFFKCGEKLCAKVVWLKVPTYIDSNDGPVGTLKLDRKNPNPSLRKRPIIGLQVMSGLTKTGDNQWGNGTCYDPESGKSYKCSMELVSPTRLKLRGYIGISIFGRNYILTR
jgi:uncharacterized protein (DUF2147 family)